MTQFYRTRFLFLLFILFSGAVNAQQVTITEINYNPDSTKNSGDWFELHNLTGSAINMAGWRIRDDSPTGLYLVQPGVVLPANGYLVFCSDSLRFDAVYNIANRIGDLGFGFNNNADSIRIFDALNAPVLRMGYQDSLPWPIGADGYGRTLELKTTASDPRLPASWRTGCMLGSPGAAFSPCVNEKIVISEINYRSDISMEAGDWIELKNIGNTTQNLSNWVFRDDDNQHIFVFPSGTSLAPNGRLVIMSDPVNFNLRHPGVVNKIGPFSFGLNGDGDALRIYDQLDQIYFSVWYDDEAPWANEPDGLGYTLEADTLFNPSRDVCDASSWMAGCPEGSPGRAYDPDCFAGTADENGIANVSVFPNPSSDFISVTWPETLGNSGQPVLLINMAGQRFPLGSRSQSSFSIQHIPAGVYWLASEDQKYSPLTISNPIIILSH